MKILVTGGHGQLGHALKKVLASEEAQFTDSDDMDITDPAKIEEAFLSFKPDWLFHGAAYTNVDGCEEHPELAEKVNATGTKNLAEACKKHGVKMIYISTDYVFDGSATAPIPENATTGPLSVYGKTKLAGELATRDIADGYVLRTSWVYGDGNNFVKTMLVLSEKMDEIKVVSDQLGRPTYAEDLARAMYEVALSFPRHSSEGWNPASHLSIPVRPGIYNVTGDGDIISWADFAREVFKIAGKATKVIDITTGEYLSDKQDRKIASRPMYSALDLTKIKSEGIRLAQWQDSLRNYITKGI